MSLDYHAHESARSPGVINSDYRTTLQNDGCTDEKICFPTSTSSSSSSPSGAATPVDVVGPELASFPRVAAHTLPAREFRSSGSSVFSLEHKRPLSKTALPFVPRPPKLSLDTCIVRPIPALPSASTESPLGAFCPTSSAESHLRHLVKQSILSPLPTRSSSPTPRYPTASTTHTRSHSVSSRELSEAKLPNKSSPSLRRLRASSFRSLSFSWSSADKTGFGHPSPYDVDADSGDEHEVQETFWPRRKQRKQATHKKVPSISRSSSPPSDDINVGAPAPSPGLISRNSTLPSPLTNSNQLKARAGSSSAARPTSPSLLSVQSRTKPSSSSSRPLSATTPLRPTMHVRSSTTSLLPPNPSRSGKSPKSFLVAGSSSSPDRSSSSSGGLNPALAAVENASRLRSRCVCGVCGKVGADYPRCPRCSATWCSRQCRVSESNGGKHTCRR